jgi:hypothetical protein
MKRAAPSSSDSVEFNGITFARWILSDHAWLLHSPIDPSWNCPEPEFPLEKTYTSIRIMDKHVQQPRITACYDHAYAYSGQVHPIEPETPESIRNMYRFVKSTFNEDVNMCLANAYLHGHHCIGKHSDDEKQMGGKHHVFCFVYGASRRAIFRRKGTIVLDLLLPEGLYVMYGQDFQKLFTHEFPRQGPEYHKMVPIEGSSLEKSDWAWKNPEEMKRILREAGKERWLKEFDQWRKSRFSYTLRYFN